MCSSTLRGILLLAAAAITPAYATTVYVGGSGTSHYSTIQTAVNALPSTGGTIEVTAGTYKEQVTISKPDVRLIGEGSSAASTILYDDLSSSNSTDEASSTLIVTTAATNFFMENIEVENTNTTEGNTRVPALAMYVVADRVVMRDVRLIGRQDTLYLGSQGCSSTTCTASRQYVYGSYIEGNVDFIFGDSAAVFSDSTIMIDENSSTSGETTITAQRRLFTNYLSGFVFLNCTVEAASSSQTNDYLGRPWNKYSKVIFIDTAMTAPIATAGWIEWSSSTAYLDTADYAEYGSTGTGASGYTSKKRESYAVYLTSSETSQYAANTFLAGSDSWEPTTVD
ncbi:pectinesterase family protein [Telmatobacter bradus]|uniref:pectinesterase family protein n=1 Tax=Telmatobacter bradus TaxID=474953 RepID=UPI003B42A8BE